MVLIIELPFLVLLLQLLKMLEHGAFMCSLLPQQLVLFLNVNISIVGF